MVTGTVSRCMMGRLRLVVSAPRPCRGWTWRLCPPGSARGRTDREPETPESASPPELTEVAPPRGRTAVTVRLVGVDEAAGVPEEDLDQDRPLGEEDQHPEDQHPEDHRGGASGAGSPEEHNSHHPAPLHTPHTPRPDP